MKKLLVLIALLLLCAAGWAGATYMVGSKVENRYLGLLEKYRQYGPVTLSSQGYQRGFLGSTAQTVLEMKVPSPKSADDQGAEEVLQLVFEHSLHHGPLPLGKDSAGQTSWTPALAQGKTRLISVSPGGEDFEKLLTEIPELAETVASFSVGLDGTTSSQIRIPEFTHQADGAKISWGGFVSDAEFGPGNNKLIGSFVMPKTDIQFDDGNISWSGLNGQFNLDEVLPLLYVGTSEMIFGTMDINVKNKKSGELKSIQMQGFDVAADSRFSDGMVDYSQTMSLTGMTVDGENFGPGIIEVEVNNLDGEMLSGFQAQVQQVYMNGTSFSPDEAIAQIMPLYTQMFEKLIEGTPEVKIKRLSFATPSGDIKGNMQVKFAGREGLEISNPAALLEYLEANANLEINEELVKVVAMDGLQKQLKAARKQGQIPQYSDAELTTLAEQQLAGQIQGLLAQNFIVRDGERLTANAIFNRGEFMLNGNSLPIFQAQ